MHFELFDLVYVVGGATAGGVGVGIFYRRIVEEYNQSVQALRRLTNNLFDDLMVERDLNEGMAQELADAAAKKTTTRRK